jgi:hypothetical protein
MLDTSTELKALNRDIWDFLPKLNAHLAERRREARRQEKANRDAKVSPPATLT